MEREKELDDLIAAFAQQLRQEHANPERVGCPNDAVLKSFAREAGSSDARKILDHIRQCAPCLDELRNLRTAHRRKR